MIASNEWEWYDEQKIADGCGCSDAVILRKSGGKRYRAFVYSFYYTLISYGDFGLNDEISLCREDIEILSDGTVKTVGDFTVKRCEIPNTASSPEGFE